jgi:predicted negative regulator of RcsB-dependent stress response
MAVYDLEEQEQLDELKTWWRQYGNLVVNIALVVAVLLAAWQGWNWWQHKQSGEAAAMYSAVQVAVSQQDAKRARELAGTLIDQYPRTTYAGMSALIASRVQIDSGDAKNAKVQLEWAAANANDPALRELARLRLVSLLIDEKSYDEAMNKLAAPALQGFAVRHGELKGDVLAAQGKTAEAKTAYTAASDQLEIELKQAEGNAQRGLTMLKEILAGKRDAVANAPIAQNAPAGDAK